MGHSLAPRPRSGVYNRPQGKNAAVQTPIPKGERRMCTRKTQLLRAATYAFNVKRQDPRFVVRECVCVVLLLLSDHRHRPQIKCEMSRLQKHSCVFSVAGQASSQLSSSRFQSLALARLARLASQASSFASV